jgi:predicted MFS family arabinose efflux permease
MLAFAVAIGIGRFASTPLLPLMQSDVGLTLSQGAWLASANYLGYLLGAISVAWLRAPGAKLLRFVLLAIALLTLAMGIAHDQLAWLLLRATAGVASAWALVIASAWTLPRLATAKPRGLDGVVFGGVGFGIALTGAACLLLGSFGWSSSHSWLALGAVALMLTFAAWPGFREHPGAEPQRSNARRANGDADPWQRHVLIVLCYGVFGFGYIVPATFLPAMARSVVSDPAVFGWAWPVFGMAALASTLMAGRLLSAVSSKMVWGTAHMIMAIGVALPIAWPGMGGILAASFFVGGTFMVATLAGLQEARRAASGNPVRLMAGMTAAFAAGQMLGPTVIGWLRHEQRGVPLSLSVAALALLLTGSALLLSASIERRRRACSLRTRFEES